MERPFLDSLSEADDQIQHGEGFEDAVCATEGDGHTSLASTTPDLWRHCQNRRKADENALWFVAPNLIWSPYERKNPFVRLIGTT